MLSGVSEAVLISFYVDAFLQTVPNENDAVAEARQLLTMLTNDG